MYSFDVKSTIVYMELFTVFKAITSEVTVIK